jgi:hypothetical protein
MIYFRHDKFLAKYRENVNPCNRAAVQLLSPQININVNENLELSFLAHFPTFRNDPSNSYEDACLST